MVEHALRYAERGFFVIPVVGKKPTIKSWMHRATIKPAQIRRWWAKWPNANIGIVTHRSGIVVLDVDPGDRGGGESLERIVALVGHELIDAPTVFTSRGGRHLYFALPDPDVVRALRKFVKPGIDVTPYVVAPPSMHASGEQYRWKPGDENAEPRPLPAALIAAALGPFETLHPPVVGGARGALEVRNRSNFGAAQKFAEKRATLERYARRFARRGASCQPTADDGGTRLLPRVVKWIETPGEWIVNEHKNSIAIRNGLISSARDYVRVYGEDGKRFFRAALAQKSAISPAYRRPSPTSSDNRNPLAWEPFGRRAWERALAEPSTDVPIDLDAIASAVPASERRAFNRGAAAYAALLLEAWRLGVKAVNFRKDRSSIARALGVSKATADRYVLDAVNFGLVLILDPGKARAKGECGRTALFCIVTAKVNASGERVEQLVDRTSRLRLTKLSDRDALHLAG